MRKFFPIVTIMALVISGCSSSKKTQTPANPLLDNEWMLTELMGKPIQKADAAQLKITMKFTKDGNRVSGFSGCNTYSGTYTSETELRVSFSQMISTMMACPMNMDIEAEYLKMLSQVDNYTIGDNKLSLNKARMAPLARFEKVKAK
jgi:heat shock protein HslJ